MNKPQSVQCVVQGYLHNIKPYQITFDSGKDIQLLPTGGLGPQGVSETASDLLDIAVAIYTIEKHMKGNKRTNPADSISLKMKLRNPKIWNDKAIQLLQDILLFLGNATWDIKFTSGLKSPKIEYEVVENKNIEKIILFSGGMDSTCGLMTLSNLDEKEKVCLTSFYTIQKAMQKNIARDLDFENHVQWGRKLSIPAGVGKSFYYRSFLFLSLAAVTAESWGAKNIVQFENGILAAAIPPSPAWRMTKHAHPLMHEMMAKLLDYLFGGEWKIENPFRLKTKRECYLEAVQAVGSERVIHIIKKTETCWFHYSNKVAGGKSKSPRTPCGACIPCLIRRTAFDHDKFKWDLCKDKNKNDDRIGINFRSYYGFTEQILKTRASILEFYRLLPASGRQLVGVKNIYDLRDLHMLFLRFAQEFQDTFGS